MRLAVMQPYFYPYLGYFQLIHHADLFVVYDTVQYMKGGWINRNRILLDGTERFVTVPVVRGSLADRIQEKQIDRRDGKWVSRILGQVSAAYRNASCYASVFPSLREALCVEEMGLSRYVRHQMEWACQRLGIDTEFVFASELVPECLGGSAVARLLAMCRRVGATEYVNAIGGRKLYSREDFASEGVELSFLVTCCPQYRQAGDAFFPDLSVIDTMMNCSGSEIVDMLPCYEILRADSR